MTNWLQSQINSRANRDTFLYPNSGPGGAYIRLPATYLRAGLPPVDEFGNQIASYYGGSAIDAPRGAGDGRELGVSVFTAWHDPKTGMYLLESGDDVLTQDEAGTANRAWYEVTGESIGEGGAAGETLLKPGTVKIVREVNLDNVVGSTGEHTVSGNELLTQELIDMYPGLTGRMAPNPLAIQEDEYRTERI